MRWGRGIHVFLQSQIKDVDGRHKAGHDARVHQFEAIARYGALLTVEPVPDALILRTPQVALHCSNSTEQAEVACPTSVLPDVLADAVHATNVLKHAVHLFSVSESKPQVQHESRHALTSST